MADIDYNLVLVEEFDALAIEVRAADDCMDLSEYGKYPAKAHAQKVAAELGVKTGLIYLPALPNKPFEDSDMYPEFRQRRYFFYMSGVEFADAALTYDISTDELILWVPYIEPRKALYLGSVPTKKECMRRYDIDDCGFMAFAGRWISRHLASHPGTVLYVLHEDQAPRLDRHRGTLTVDHGSLRPAMDAARVIKTPYEVRAIRKANAVSSAAHRLVLTRLKSFRSEAEIEGVFMGCCLSRGAKHQAYPVIAGSGPNAATLHYEANNEPLAGRQVVVLDAGAEWGCYASDITRTLPIGGRFTAEGGAIYAAVDKMQRTCIERVRPGYPYRGLHAAAQTVAVEELLKLGILCGGSVDEVLATGVVAAFFPHGLGHHVGMEVHDVWSDRLMKPSGSIPERGDSGTRSSGMGVLGKRSFVSCDFSAALARAAILAGEEGESVDEGGRLAENMVVTIEPGIYFNRAFVEAFIQDEPKRGRYIDTTVLEKYYAVGGVRIEDDILVTSTGYEILSTAPKGDEALKIINGE